MKKKCLLDCSSSRACFRKWKLRLRKDDAAEKSDHKNQSVVDGPIDWLIDWLIYQISFWGH